MHINLSIKEKQILRGSTILGFAGLSACLFLFLYIPSGGVLSIVSIVAPVLTLVIPVIFLAALYTTFKLIEKKNKKVKVTFSKKVPKEEKFHKVSETERAEEALEQVNNHRVLEDKEDQTIPVKNSNSHQPPVITPSFNAADLKKSVFYLIQENKPEAIRKLMKDNKENINTKDRTGMTPIMRATLAGRKEIVEILLEMDDIDLKHRVIIDEELGSNNNVLEFAISYGIEDIALILMDRDIPINEENQPNLIESTMHRNQYNILTALKDKRDIKCNITDDNGESIFTKAITIEKYKFAETLLEKDEVEEQELASAILDLCSSSHSNEAENLIKKSKKSLFNKIPEEDIFNIMKSSIKQNFLQIIKLVLDKKPKLNTAILLKEENIDQHIKLLLQENTYEDIYAKNLTPSTPSTSQMGR